MNWLMFSVIGAAAVWFEYNYRRSKKHDGAAETPAPADGKLPVPESAHVEQAGAAPSISPGSENDKKLNVTV